METLERLTQKEKRKFKPELCRTVTMQLWGETGRRKGISRGMGEKSEAAGRGDQCPSASGC